MAKISAKDFLKQKYITAAVLLFIGVALGAFFLMSRTTDNPQNMSDVNTVKEAVSRHILLPADEQPALATVTDKAKLTNPFLKKAENGDRLLIYQVNKRIIIYRPSIDRLIDVGPVEISTPTGL